MVLGGLVGAGILGWAALVATSHTNVTKLLGAAGYVIGALVLLLLLVIQHRQRRLTETLRQQLTALAKAESRHDYHRRRQIDQVQSVLARLRFMVEGINGANRPHDQRLALPFDQDSQLPRVLFVTSNGAGMGHLTRCLAIARSGRKMFQAQFVSLSSSAEIVEALGFSVLKFPSQSMSSHDSAAWNDDFAVFFDDVCRINRPQAVVFDGTWIYRAVHESARRHGASLVWLRRGLWMEGSDISQLQSASKFVDRVLVPRDVADTVDKGPTSRLDGVVVPAPTLTTPSDCLSRDDALGTLGLDPARNYVLLQLGAGAINDVSDARELAITQILQHSPSTDVVVGLSPLSRSYVDERPRVHVVRQYPVAKFLAAFDFMVIAAGYNSVHESIRFQTPAIVVPNRHTSTDNQTLRASEYERLGFGLAAHSLDELTRALGSFFVPEVRERFTKALCTAAVPLDSGEGAATKIEEWAISRQLAL